MEFFSFDAYSFLLSYYDNFRGEFWDIVWLPDRSNSLCSSSICRGSGRLHQGSIQSGKDNVLGLFRVSSNNVVLSVKICLQTHYFRSCCCLPDYPVWTGPALPLRLAGHWGINFTSIKSNGKEVCFIVTICLSSDTLPALLPGKLVSRIFGSPSPGLWGTWSWTSWTCGGGSRAGQHTSSSGRRSGRGGKYISSDIKAFKAFGSYIKPKLLQTGPWGCQQILPSKFSPINVGLVCKKWGINYNQAPLFKFFIV